MNILFDYQKSYIIDTSGARQQSPIYLSYQSKPTWIINFKNVDDTVSNIDLSDAVTWSSAVDKDFNSTTEPMVRTLNTDIDSSDAINGNISIILDTDTTTFQDAIGTSRTINAYFELRGFNASGDEIYYCQFKIIALNKLDVGTGDPLTPVENYYTKSQIDSIIPNYDDLSFTVNDLDANNILVIPSLVTVSQIIDQDGLIVQLALSDLIYDELNNVTKIDLTSYVVALSDNTWKVKFAGGQNSVVNDSINCYSFINEIVTSEYDYIELTEDSGLAQSKWLSGIIKNTTRLKFKIKSSSATITGNVYLAIGGTDVGTYYEIPVTTEWVEKEIPIDCISSYKYAFIRDAANVLDTLNDAGAIVGCQIMSGVERAN